MQRLYLTSIQARVLLGANVTKISGSKKKGQYFVHTEFQVFVFTSCNREIMSEIIKYSTYAFGSVDSPTSSQNSHLRLNLILAACLPWPSPFHALCLQHIYLSTAAAKEKADHTLRCSIYLLPIRFYQTNYQDEKNSRIGQRYLILQSIHP